MINEIINQIKSEIEKSGYEVTSTNSAFKDPSSIGFLCPGAPIVDIINIIKTLGAEDYINRNVSATIYAIGKLYILDEVFIYLIDSNKRQGVVVTIAPKSIFE